MGFGSWITNVFKALFGQLKITITNFLEKFVKEDFGPFVIAAVTLAEAYTNKSGDEKKQIAKDALLDSLKKAGYDITQFGESVLNFLIETGLQALLAQANKGVTAIKQ